jgi:hypothetical protein
MKNIEKIASEIFSTTMTIDDLFNTPSVKIAMSTGELLFRTSKKSIKYASGCFATTKRNDPRNGRWSFTVKCHASYSRGPYEVRFKLKGKIPKTSSILEKQIQVSCNCNAWKYWGADFNALRGGYSEKQYSNNQAPNVRDRKRSFLICKHVAACVPIFKKFLIPQNFK